MAVTTGSGAETSGSSTPSSDPRAAEQFETSRTLAAQADAVSRNGDSGFHAAVQFDESPAGRNWESIAVRPAPNWALATSHGRALQSVPVRAPATAVVTGLMIVRPSIADG